jgi:hypothetical protein
MRNLKWLTVAGMAAGLIIAGYSVTSLVGCSNATTASTRPAPSSLHEGVNMLDVSRPTWGMNAAYVAKGRAVYLETRVGGLKPDVYRNDAPNEPQNEMDMRFLDQNGNTFYVMRGGDNLVDPTWAADMAQTHDANLKVNKVDRDADWALAREAAGALAPQLAPEFSDHAFHLANFAGQMLPSENTRLIARESTIRTVDVPQTEAAYGTMGASGAVYTYPETDKYSKGTVCALWICAASHSATAMWLCTWNGTGCTWSSELNACNHGTCAQTSGSGQSAMKYDCSTTGSVWTYGSVSYNGETSTGPTGNNDGTGGCQTSYSWNSGSGSHLCNDDAAYELYQSAHSVSNLSGTTFAVGNQGSHCDGDACGSSPSNFACNCAGGNCSGDWNTPNCQSTNF